MPLIIWDDALNVGNAEIDRQHQRWVAILNDLHDALMQNSAQEIGQVTINSLQAMLDYARYHFAYEEEWLGKINYPDLVEHRRLHKDFDAQLYDYHRDIRDGKTVLSSKIIKVLKNWLLDHIAVEDQKYKHFLAGQ